MVRLTAAPDAGWLHARLAEVEAGHPRRVKEWARLAKEWADLEVCWTVMVDTASDELLEHQLIAGHPGLWNRRHAVLGERLAERPSRT